MLPTFTTFTQRHPRATVVFGLAVFTMGITIWGFVILGIDSPQEIIVRNNVPNEEVIVDEKVVVLDSLKNTEPDTLSMEEKSEILDSLKNTEPDLITEEEKLRILAELADPQTNTASVSTTEDSNSSDEVGS